MAKAKTKVKAAAKKTRGKVETKPEPKLKLKAGALPEAMSTAERNAIIDGICSRAETTYGSAAVQRAQDTHCSYMLRRPTGITSLDIGLGGGFPASAPSVLVGPDSSGKDYLLWKTGAETQRLYGDDFCMAVYFTEFKPDKIFMKDFCGLQIAFSEKELEEMSQARFAAGQPELTEDELDHYRYQIGNFISIHGVSADHGFDEIFKFLDANVCQIVAVNSIGFLQTEAKENTDSFEDHAQQRNEAALLTKFMPKIAMYLNRGTTKGVPNETSIILVNQVRSAEAKRAMPGRPTQEKDTYKTAANSFALKHAKAIELFLHNGPRITEKDPPYTNLGRKKSWEITKGKLGVHEGIKGEFDFFHGKGADVALDLVDVACGLGVFRIAGSWVYYEEDENLAFQAQSTAKAARILSGNPELYQHIRHRCFQEAKTMYRHR